MCLISEIVSWVWWMAPFTFVFSFMAAIKENNKDGENDIKYGVISAVSLLIIVAACMS